ncbi:MAG: LysR family transcriptional regulator [Pseudomonadaceae bacterium]
MSSLIDLKRLNHLVLLGEELHFSRAAERAHLSQTAFSRSIQSLESDLQLRLFDRGTRSVQLTAAGRQILSLARDLLRQADNLGTAALHLANAEGGELNFGVGLLAAHSYMQEVLPALRRECPGLRLNVEVDHWQNLLRHLEQERIEFMVGGTGQLQEDPRLKVTPLPSRATAIYCRSGHPLLTLARPVNADSLLSYPWSAALLDDASLLQMLSLLDLGSDARPTSLMSCNSLSLLRQTALHSDSLLFTWDGWLEEELAAGLLVDLTVCLEPNLPALRFTLDSTLVQLANRTLSPPAQRAVAMILQCAEHQRG